MPKMLIDGAIEYEDGTPATESQAIFLLPSLHFVLLSLVITQQYILHKKFCKNLVSFLYL